MNKIDFTKMHGLGNDFMLINAIDKSFNPKPELIQAWGRRKTGVGFDQFLLLESSDLDVHVAKYRIFNADGTEVEQCGNGARCIAKYLIDNHYVQAGEFTVETMTRVLKIRYESDDAISVNMGEPRYSDETELAFEGQSIPFVPVDLGNPHAVFFVSTININHLEEIAKLLHDDERYPDGVNVSFAKIISNNEIKVKTFERGVGMTEACGSGACAAIVAGILTRDLSETVKAHLGLGDIIGQWSKGQDVLMTGPARAVYQGTLIY